MLQQQFVLTLTCPDRPGIVRAIAEAVYALAGNIVDNSQYTDPVTGIFCVRTVFDTPQTEINEVRTVMDRWLQPYSPQVQLRPSHQRYRTLIMVSQQDHCLVDLLYRWQTGELPIDIPLVVSNHDDSREIVERAGIDFHHLPVTPHTKPAAEAQLMKLADKHHIELMVLARYMQVLSPQVCARFAGSIINIHHSFLPGFKGAKPYQRAFERGVKLIGATAHYVTTDLDEGPIIEQDVERVTHAHEVANLVAMGRDIERVVLARAIRLHADNRVLVAGARTVVFP